MPDDNESQPQDAEHQDPPRSSHEAAAETNGVARILKGGWPSRTAPTKVDALAEADHGVQHLTSLLEKPASDLDLEVLRLKAERTEMKREKKRLSAQLRNTERKRSRLCTRARQLSTNDLLEVYAMRVRASTARDTQNAPAEG